MNLNLTASLAIWFLFPFALVFVIAFASDIHDSFIKRRRKPATRLTAHAASVGCREDQRDKNLLNKITMRGYDNPELFREDLWLLRMHRSRKARLALPYEISAQPGKSICAILAQHPGTRCDN